MLCLFHCIVKRETAALRRTIECAKHIAMMEKTERGKQVRQPEQRPRCLPSLAERQMETMFSLVISELTRKEHKHVMLDIRVILKQAGIDGSKFGRVYLGGNGQERPCYLLSRFECYLFISGYPVMYRAAII